MATMMIQPQLACTQCQEHADFVSTEHEKPFCSCECFKQFIQQSGEAPPTILFNAVVPKKSSVVRPQSIGPRSDLPYSVPESLRKFMLKATKYVAALPLFDQYLVWRYTAGSASVNGSLIAGGKVSDIKNAAYWCYQFFLYWKNTVDSGAGDGGGKVASPFFKYDKYFKNPASFLALSTTERATLVPAIVRLYALALQKIILASPPVKGDDGFHVFKVASDYPGLPQSPTDVPKTLKQLPFNSTTVNPHFNFAFFIQEEAKGNVFDLHIPVGARVLYIPAEYHAYPFEREILLPFGCQFKITAVYTGKLDYIDSKSHNIVTLQKPPTSIMMGPVYELDDYEPCTGGVCVIKRKNFRTFIAEYIAP